jgi:hypothetical protein
LAATVEATTAAVMNPKTENDEDPDGGFGWGEGHISVSSEIKGRIILQFQSDVKHAIDKRYDCRITRTILLR